ncbi:hypothetical protein D3C71_2173970 [compost metagenome]
MEQISQVLIVLDHVSRRGEGVLRYLDRWRQNDQLGRLPPVADQQCQHDRCGDCGLRVLLGDDQSELFDLTPTSVRVV